MKIYLVILNWVLLMSLLTVIALGILGGERQHPLART